MATKLSETRLDVRDHPSNVNSGLYKDFQQRTTFCFDEHLSNSWIQIVTVITVIHLDLITICKFLILHSCKTTGELSLLVVVLVVIVVTVVILLSGHV